jgi:hypothetical protein
MNARIVAMSKKKELVPVSAAKMLPTLWAGRGYADFDDFEGLGETLVHQVRSIEKIAEQLEEAIEKGNVTQRHIDIAEEALASWRWSDSADFEEYKQMFKYWERDELYQKLKKPKCDHLGGLVSYAIKDEVVGWHVAGLLANSSFNPASAEAGQIFTTTLIEEIKRARPSASAIESTCREIRRSEKFIKYPPKIPEVLALLLKHEKAWSDRNPESSSVDLEYSKDELREVVARAKQAPSWCELAKDHQNGIPIWS